MSDEPGGYSGYQALYGHKYVVPVIAASGLSHLFGNPITGFPGFGGISAAQTLAYVAAMQENGVPVTYAYISDAHDGHSVSAGFRALGPAEQGYLQQLQAYDTAWVPWVSPSSGSPQKRSRETQTLTALSMRKSLRSPGCATP